MAATMGLESVSCDVMFFCLPSSCTSCGVCLPQAPLLASRGSLGWAAPTEHLAGSVDLLCSWSGGESRLWWSNYVHSLTRTRGDISCVGQQHGSGGGEWTLERSHLVADPEPLSSPHVTGKGDSLLLQLVLLQGSGWHNGLEGHRGMMVALLAG